MIIPGFPGKGIYAPPLAGLDQSIVHGAGTLPKGYIIDLPGTDSLVDRRKFALSIWYRLGAMGTDGWQGYFVLGLPTYPEFSIGIDGYYGATWVTMRNAAGAVELNAELAISTMLPAPGINHLLILVDTTQAVAADRTRYYHNGVLELKTWVFGSGTLEPTLNKEFDVFTGPYQAYSETINTTTGLVLSEVLLSTGQDYVLDDFGWDDAGTWRRRIFDKSFGANGFALNWDGAATIYDGSDKSGKNRIVTYDPSWASTTFIADVPPQ